MKKQFNVLLALCLMVNFGLGCKQNDQTTDNRNENEPQYRIKLCGSKNDVSKCVNVDRLDDCDAYEAAKRDGTFSDPSGWKNVTCEDLPGPGVRLINGEVEEIIQTDERENNTEK